MAGEGKRKKEKTNRPRIKPDGKKHTKGIGELTVCRSHLARGLARGGME